MKTVKFVKSLNIEEVPCGDRESLLKYHTWDDVVPIRYSDDWLVSENCFKTKIVPIMELFEYTKSHPDLPVELKETYIAISEEVDDLLGKPYSSLKQENSELAQELVSAWATIRENKDTIAELERWNKEGCNVAVKLHQALMAQIIAMNDAPWWKRLFKKWE